MNRISRISFFVATLLVSTGCSGYRLAYLPGDIRGSSEVGCASSVVTGKRVRLTLLSGETVEGVVTAVTDSRLEIATISRDVSLAAYDARQFAKLEVYVEKPAGAELGAAALVVGGLIGGYYLVNSGDTVRYEPHTAK